MKPILFLLFTCISGISSAQYFNISPTIYTETSANEFHYVVTGITDFSDSLVLVLHADLVTDDEQLTVITSQVYDLSDTIAANSPGLTLNSTEHTFSIDLGNQSSNQYMLHIWITIAGEVFNEMYYKQ